MLQIIGYDRSNTGNVASLPSPIYVVVGDRGIQVRDMERWEGCKVECSAVTRCVCEVEVLRVRVNV